MPSRRTFIPLFVTLLSCYTLARAAKDGDLNELLSKTVLARLFLPRHHVHPV